MNELAKSYNPKETEDRIYKFWEDSGAFKPMESDQDPFTIVIPPPNVTGNLHMGHALNNTIQDILVRRARMQGHQTLWLPGTDHAGIATQNVVEKQLAKEGKNRNDLGREEFVKRVWAWVDEYGDIIINQLKKMGCSCDWSRQRFTMDKDYQEAVNTAFKHYYSKGWIYQGERVINWCPRCQTSLSDIEVEYKEIPGKLYYFKYDKDFPITIATTRPETKLGDVAVAVNPKDKRYEEYIGKTFDINFVGVKRKIKIIGDDSIDQKFGTGAVGVTPAHSIIDAELAEKHKLQSITIIDKFGKIALINSEFDGLKVTEAREKVIEKLKKDNLIEKTEDYNHNLSVCYRCGKEIEPQPSRQWFLKMSELIKPAIDAIKNDEIKITPTRWKKVYLDWMENIRDWCISRQIWWGHKIPIEGETDVLDTWFSSALWPFATLGYPKETDDLKKFYPTTILSTARDINMLWVVRMIFSGLEFMKEKPFSQVYVHPTVFNKEGKRMSKSLGTGVDPLVLIDKYGADAVRFGLAYINTGTQDIKFDENAILASQKFGNKVWNINRFVLQQIESSKLKDQSPNEILNPKTDADKLILSHLTSLISSINSDLDAFRFGQAAHDLYDFVWHDFADQYIETAKTQLDDPNLHDNTLLILNYALTNSLILLHPFMPFLTEEIWQTLYEEKLVDEKMLITAKWAEVR
jgi:valyl-tRNA synthetase